MKLTRKDGNYVKGTKVIGKVPAEQLALEKEAVKQASVAEEGAKKKAKGKSKADG